MGYKEPKNMKNDTPDDNTLEYLINFIKKKMFTKRSSLNQNPPQTIPLRPSLPLLLRRHFKLVFAENNR